MDAGRRYAVQRYLYDHQTGAGVPRRVDDHFHDGFDAATAAGYSGALRLVFALAYELAASALYDRQHASPWKDTPFMAGRRDAAALWDEDPTIFDRRDDGRLDARYNEQERHMTPENRAAYHDGFTRATLIALRPRARDLDMWGRPAKTPAP